MSDRLFNIPTASSGRAIRENIEAVAKLDADFHKNRTLADRIADAIGGFSGSLRFVLIHLFIYAAWIALNLHAIRWVHPWDPFPFILLNLAVSLEAIFLSTFVLIKQNRMSQRDDLRAHVDLQINLLAEREMTLVLRALQHISASLGAPLSGSEFRDLTEETSVAAIADQVKASLIAETQAGTPANSLPGNGLKPQG